MTNLIVLLAAAKFVYAARLNTTGMVAFMLEAIWEEEVIGEKIANKQ